MIVKECQPAREEQITRRSPIHHHQRMQRTMIVRAQRTMVIRGISAKQDSRGTRCAEGKQSAHMAALDSKRHTFAVFENRKVVLAETAQGINASMQNLDEGASPEEKGREGSR